MADPTMLSITDAAPQASEPSMLSIDEPSPAKARMAAHKAILDKAPSFGSDLHGLANAAADVVDQGLVNPALRGAGGLAHNWVSKFLPESVIPNTEADKESWRNAAGDLFGGPLQNPETAPVAAGISGVGHALHDAAHNTFPIAAPLVEAGLHAARTGAESVFGKENVQSGLNTVGDVAGVAGVVAPGEGAVSRVAEGNAAEEAARLAAARAPAVTPDAVAKNFGYRLSPSTVAQMTGASETPTRTALLAERVAGQGATQENRLFNRTNSNSLAAQEVGLTPNTTLSPENLAKAEEPANEGYDRIRGMLPNRTPVSDANASTLRATGAADSLGRAMPKEVGDVADLLSTEPMNATDLMSRISTLRQEGYKRITPTVPGGTVDPATAAWGSAQLDQANALEKELNDRIARVNPDMAGQFQGWRALYAKVNTIRRAMSGKGLGYDIDPAKLATAAAKSDALTGRLRGIAESYAHAPQDIGLNVTPEATVSDAQLALGGASGGLLASAYGHPVTGALLAATGLARPVARSILRNTHGAVPADLVDTSAAGPLGRFFPQRPTAPAASPFGLESPPGRAFEPGQPSMLRTGENVPVAEQGGLPPGLSLTSPQNTRAFKPGAQPSLLRSGENVPVAEQGGLPPGLTLQPPLGTALDPHQRGLMAGGNMGPLRDQGGMPPSETLTYPPGNAFEPHQPDLPLGGQSQLYHASPTKGLTSLAPGNNPVARGHGIYLSDDESVAAPHGGKNGQTYPVNVDPDTLGRTLQWDQSLRAQPDVKAAFAKLGVTGDMTAGDAYRALSDKLKTGAEKGKGGAAGENGITPSGDKAASAALSKEGIPGIKYSASGKYSTGGSKGNNYVIFDSKDASIVPAKKLGDDLAGK